jgi:predicted nucleic acid-binding protein
VDSAAEPHWCMCYTGTYEVRWRPHRALLGRALALPHQLSAYDAIYVAMAEVTGATLLTRDGRLAGTTGHRATIEVV